MNTRREVGYRATADAPPGAGAHQRPRTTLLVVLPLPHGRPKGLCGAEGDLKVAS